MPIPKSVLAELVAFYTRSPETPNGIPLAAPLFEPLLAVVPLQVFAMELAEAKGLDVDQPRNLAKSVTVE